MPKTLGIPINIQQMSLTNVSLMTNVIMSVIFGPLLLTGFSAGYDSHFPVFWYVL